MTIQGAQEYSREHGLTTCRTGNIVMIDADCYAPICVIEAALDNGYQLCKVDEIIKELEDRKEESDLNEVAGLIEDEINAVLDKIRAEIEELKNAPPCFDDMFEYKYAVDECLEIIDKYKAESEVQE